MDAQRATCKLWPPLKIYGSPVVDRRCLLTVNHYSRRGFQAWWIALAVSSATPQEIHWVITAAWRYPDRLRSWLITPTSRWVLQRIAHLYNFTIMPPMPPEPEETAARAKAVREIIRRVKYNECSLIGLAPEGGDFAAAGDVAELPKGTGRFALLMAGLGMDIQPVGIFEDQGLCVRFGQPYHLTAPQGLDADARDAWARRILREKILAELPRKT